MREGLTRLETYTNEIEAEIAKGRLEALGVTVVLTKDNCGGMRPHLDLQAGVKLFVLDEEYDKAREILATRAVAATGNWVCGVCNEVIEGSFDVCWHCGRDRE